MSTRSIGIDLSVKDVHKAIVVDEQGQFVTGLLKVQPRAAEIDRLLRQARRDAPGAALQAIMEPTGMAWFPVAVYLKRQGVSSYLVNSQQVADLRRFYKRHAKSDRIDVRVLAKLPQVNGDQLHALVLPDATTLACQRACRQHWRLVRHMTAIRNRVRAIDRFAWPGLEEVFPEPWAPVVRWFRSRWYDPQQVCQRGASALAEAWELLSGETAAEAGWSAALVKLAAESVALYGGEGTYLDFAQLQSEVAREQALLAFLEEQEQYVRLKVIRPLYRQIHPSRHLETLKGVGEASAAVYASFIGDAKRFASLHAFRGWSGLVPDSRQSADAEAKGLHITQAGPELIKAYAYLDADVARRHDPQLAKLYYEQMVRFGKHHQQALCACATHLLDRILVVLREDRAYQLRDVDGTEVSSEQAHQIVAECYTVPKEVRQRNAKRKRRERADERAERKTKRESRPTR